MCIRDRGYPYLANYVFEHETTSLVNSVEKIEEMTDDTEKEETKKSVKQYNEKLFSNGVKPVSYTHLEEKQTKQQSHQILTL